jgi:AcrR family transcriptional regulator
MLLIKRSINFVTGVNHSMARTPKVVEDRREQILEAAMHVFAQKGYARATMKDIALAVGVTSGLIYHYFENKEALLKAIIEARSPVQDVRTLPLQLRTLPLEAMLQTLVERMLGIAEDERFVQLIRVFLPEVIQNSAIAPLGLATFQEEVLFLKDELAEHMQSGELRQADPALLAQVIMGSVMGFVLRRQILRDGLALQYTQEQIAESIVSMAVHGMRTP